MLVSSSIGSRASGQSDRSTALPVRRNPSRSRCTASSTHPVSAAAPMNTNKPSDASSRTTPRRRSRSVTDRNDCSPQHARTSVSRRHHVDGHPLPSGWSRNSTSTIGLRPTESSSAPSRPIPTSRSYSTRAFGRVGHRAAAVRDVGLDALLQVEQEVGLAQHVGAGESREGSGPSGSIRQTEKDGQRPIEPYQVFREQLAKMVLKVSSRHCRHLVDHELARLVQAIERRRLHSDPRQRCLDRIRRQRTHRHRRGCIEAVVLHDHHRARLARVGARSRGGIDLAAPQPGCGLSSAGHSDEMASTNA